MARNRELVGDPLGPAWVAWPQSAAHVSLATPLNSGSGAGADEALGLVLQDVEAILELVLQLEELLDLVEL